MACQNNDLNKCLVSVPLMPAACDRRGIRNLLPRRYHGPNLTAPPSYLLVPSFYYRPTGFSGRICSHDYIRLVLSSRTNLSETHASSLLSSAPVISFPVPRRQLRAEAAKFTAFGEQVPIKRGFAQKVFMQTPVSMSLRQSRAR